MSSRRQLIVSNTLLLYGRMLFTMWLNLWTTRLTLQHLGVDDLGVYGIVGSVVSVFGLLTGGVTTAVQRFMTYELGRGQEGDVQGVFCTSLSLLMVLGGGLVLLLELIGPWLLQHWVQIPNGSQMAAQWVLQFTIITFLFGLLIIPYHALVIAHERISVFAMISILQVVLNCLTAWSLSFFSDGRLIVYGAGMAAIAVLLPLLYHLYCRSHFAEARFRFSLHGPQLRQMGRFAGVTTLSGVFQLMSGEGIALVINWTFGVALNAVYAIALQLKNMVLSFALNLFKAIQPQITKTYAEGDLTLHKRLVYSGSKLEVYLIYVLMMPFLCRTHRVMQLWLGEVPPYMVEFVRGTIFISLTYAAFEPLRTSVLATGRIARFLLIPEGLYLLVLPLSWGVARLTDSPVWMLVTIVGLDIIVCMIRIVLGARVSAFTTGQVIMQVICPAAVVGLLDGGVCILLSKSLPVSLIGLLAVVIINVFVLAVIIWLAGLDREERQVVLTQLRCYKHHAEQ